MAPFRKKPVKWDGDIGNGRYKNKDGYKYDIVTQSVVKKTEDMPECFLADTPEEAESIYNKFEKLINSFAYSYAMSTGLNKVDLFGEALIGLARAYRDWDPKRSDDFRLYATFRIKDALNEFARNNATSILVPSYVKKAYSNLKEVIAICESTDVDYHMVIDNYFFPENLTVEDAVRCTQLVRNLTNAAKRAKVDYSKFIERISLMPQETEYSDQISPETHVRDSERLEAALIVDKLKEHMDITELSICEGIMLDKSLDQIGKEMGKSKSWVSGKLKKLREKIVEMMEAGTL